MDVLPAGLIYNNGSAAVSIDISPAPTFSVSTPNDGSQDVTLTWVFGDAVVTTSPAQITFSATVANVSSNQAGVVLNNTAKLDHSNAAGDAQPPLDAADDVTVIKPKLALAKTASPATYNAVGDVTATATC